VLKIWQEQNARFNSQGILHLAGGPTGFVYWHSWSNLLGSVVWASEHNALIMFVVYVRVKRESFTPRGENLTVFGDEVLSLRVVNRGTNKITWAQASQFVLITFSPPEGGVGLVPKRGCLLTLAYYAFPRWYEFAERRWNDILTGENRRTRRKTCPSATLSTTNPTWIDPGAKPGLRGERPATNDLSHGTALHLMLVKKFPDFYGSRRFIPCSQVRILSQIN
jgi:hypothetical protein